MVLPRDERRPAGTRGGQAGHRSWPFHGRILCAQPRHPPGAECHWHCQRGRLPRREMGQRRGPVAVAGRAGRWAKSPFVANIVLARNSAFVQRMFASLLAHERKAYRANPLSSRMLENIGPNTRQQDPAALFELFNGISRLDIAPLLGRIAIPCYVFTGSDDPVVTASQSRVIADGVPGAKVVEFPNVGHMPFIECADACARALESAIYDLSRGHVRSMPA
nr:alpha/beta fold hydrolase [Deltaproteobacteria bacterium]